MKHVLSACAFGAVLSGGALPALADQPVTINFAAELGGKPFSCHQTYAGIGSPALDVVVTDYRLFVSAPALVRADGTMQPIALEQDGPWQTGDVALLDFEDGGTHCSGTGNPGLNTSLRGSVPEGDYVGLAFTIGLPFEQNHIDPTLAPAPLNTTGMFWNWQHGFRFIRVDLALASDAAAAAPMKDAGAHGDGYAEGGHDEGMKDEVTGWFLHLGSTQCAAETGTEAPSACANPNRMQVLLTDFDAKKNTVVVDPAPVLAEVDLRMNAPETSPGCMSFPGDSDCNTVMTKLGLAFDGIPAGPQRLITTR